MKTTFNLDEMEVLKDIFVSIRKEYPSLMTNRDNFLLIIQNLYDEINTTTLPTTLPTTDTTLP
jgi:hypothetical protein